MSGDGMGGLALAIDVAMLLILLAGFVLAWLLGRRLLRNEQRWGGGKKQLARLGLGVLGLLGGLLVVIATFFESTWAPPPRLRFVTPPGFAQHWVILLEDPSARASIEWHGVELPFFGKRAEISMPPSGILRVRDLRGIAGRADLDASWSDGSPNTGAGGGPAPAGTGAQVYSAFNRAAANPDAAAEGGPPFYDSPALAAWIAARESGATGRP